MSCIQVSVQIIRQLFSWVTSFISYLANLCTSITQKLEQLQQQWQNVCTNVTSQVCNSLPWPFSTVCGWVTSLVCTLVSVLILVVVLIVEVICVTILALIAITILIVTMIISILIVLLCIVIPCKPAAMESSVPPDPGWIVTLGGVTEPALSSNNQVEVLPDGMLACQAMLSAIQNAQSDIHLLELSFQPGFEAAFPAGAMPLVLADALLAANQDNGVVVRILLNQNVFASSESDISNFFASATPNSVEVLGFQVFPEVMHAKALIVDGSVAFMVGLPLEQGYWDTQQHLVTDARRGSGAGGDITGFGDIGNGVGNKPVHTVSLMVSGQAAADTDATFISMWNTVSSDQVPAPQPVGGDGTQSVQIVRTAPSLSAAGFSNEKGTLEAYLRAIANARQLIYLEAQYFTSPVIGNALSQALQQTPELEIILLLNENPDLPTYKWWQNTNVQNVMSVAPGRVGAFALWRTKTVPGEPNEIMQCYVEAKVGIVDDAWAIIGSGNLDGASLGHIFEFLPSPLCCLSEGWRNVELGAVLYDGVAGQAHTGQVASIREQLWREHLGTEVIEGGGLALWNRIAEANIASLNSHQVLTGDSRILPYAMALDTNGQLAEIGVDTSPLNVAPAVPS